MVRITPPAKLLGNLPVNSYASPPSIQGNIESEVQNGLNISRQLEFWIEGVQLPGIMIASAENNYYGYGSTEKIPFRANFGEVTLMILADGQDDNWTFFKNWIALVVNTDISDGSTTQIKTHGMSVFESSYRVDYVGTVQIHVFDDTGKEIKNIVLSEAWPIFLGDVQMNWGENNQIMRIPVSFTFSTWYAGGPIAAPRRRQELGPFQRTSGKGKITDGWSF